MMRTYTRSGVHIEQCDNCRGIFLDYGELEAVSRLESQWGGAGPVAPAAPAWGHSYGHGHGHRSFGRVLFSS
jgi:Zn-finger nucleic acid-binding protein